MAYLAFQRLKTALAVTSFTVLSMSPSLAQTSERQVGGSCESCDLLLEGMPVTLKAETTIASKEPGERLEISGTIYEKDGKTPAKNVIVYFYHTDHKGEYSKGTTASEKTEHGRLRGWIRTGADGRYRIITIRPASYPNSRAPQHIHAIVKEEDTKPYWIDEYLFADDPMLTDREKQNQRQRGGSGVIRLSKGKNGTWTGTRDIILGKNIPGY